MANVLSVLDKATDEDIRSKVAALEVVTIRNIMGTEGMKVADKAAGMVNRVGRFLGSKKQLVKDLKPRSIEEQIQDKIEELAYTGRTELDEELRRLLAERLELKDDSSDERIAKELVNQAAKHMDMDEPLAPAERTDAVFQRYMERLEKKGIEPADKVEAIGRQINWGISALRWGWQYVKGSSGVDGELYCLLIVSARQLLGRSFAPVDDDLPDWIMGRDEETRRGIEESDAAYQSKDEKLKKTKAARDEAERRLREARASEEAARRELEKQRRELAEIQAQVENYDSIRQENEIRLGVLEGELLLAAKADKKSSLTINKLKREILRQRERIASLKAEHEANLEALENAPRRELEIRQLIEEAQVDWEKEEANVQEAERAYEEAREARAEERERRAAATRQGLEEWIGREYGSKAYELDEVLLEQMAMYNNELGKAVLKAVKQVLDADVPKDLGEEVSEGSLRLPLKGTGMFLVYGVADEGKITFMRFTDGDSLAELQRAREEKQDTP